MSLLLLLLQRLLQLLQLLRLQPERRRPVIDAGGVLPAGELGQGRRQLLLLLHRLLQLLHQMLLLLLMLLLDQRRHRPAREDRDRVVVPTSMEQVRGGAYA